MMSPTFVGLSGASRNACAAACVDGEIRAACEQERLTRVRGIGLEPGRLPAEAVETVLRLAGRQPDDVRAYVAAEAAARVRPPLPAVVVDHHEAHAATAFLTSPFRRAVVLVCDSHVDRELSVWSGEGASLHDRHWPWAGQAFASLYAQCAALFGGAQRGSAHRLEALAHLGQGLGAEKLRTLFDYREGSLRVARDWRERLGAMIDDDRAGHEGRAVETAGAVQRRIGEMLLEFVADVRASVSGEALCLGGGLFYNTYFTTLIRRSGLFTETFVPINPGNPGLAVGSALMLAHRHGSRAEDAGVSPFLGPAYDAEAIKGTLDGCKLSYAMVTDSQAIDRAAEALLRGHLVGWFQGRMEWGPRALGHRSILANPGSPYVLDNLNGFLRKRERWRAFGVSVCADAAGDLFCGLPASDFMQYEYAPRDGRLGHVMPEGATTLRVQTVTPDLGPFWALHKLIEQVTGAGVLVNTSFNGFHEPIVCNPGDAVRVFYGTGLDVLVMDRFILRK